MGLKLRTITVYGPVTAHGDRVGEPSHYRILRVTDSVEFNPGDLIGKKILSELCAAKDWKVTVTRKDDVA